MIDPQEVQILNIPSALDHLPEVDNAVEQMARLMGFSENARADLGICTTEAAMNAIVHAHRQDVSKIVEVRLERYLDRIRVIVRDHGPGFVKDVVPDPTLPENLLKECGRGLHLIRALMDDLEVTRLTDGMQIIMTKRLGGVS
jgi:serine/threonine-protein kinase RsbW